MAHGETRMGPPIIQSRKPPRRGHANKPASIVVPVRHLDPHHSRSRPANKPRIPPAGEAARLECPAQLSAGSGGTAQELTAAGDTDMRPSAAELHGIRVGVLCGPQTGIVVMRSLLNH